MLACGFDITTSVIVGFKYDIIQQIRLSGALRNKSREHTSQSDWCRSFHAISSEGKRTGNCTFSKITN